MGSFCTVQTQPLPDPKKVISGTDIPEWVSAAGRQLYEQSAEIAAQDFPKYEGPRIATFGDEVTTQGDRIQLGTDDDGNPIFQQSKLTADERAGQDLLRQGTGTFQIYGFMFTQSIESHDSQKIYVWTL